MREDTGFVERVTRYARARDRFLRMGIDVVRSPKDRGAGLHIDSLLACVQLSPDFEAAYNPLIGIAMDLAEDNRAKAEQILDELARLNPKRTDVADVKKSL
jgi:spermidine synthase